METWFTTTDTNEAAAFALLRATIKIHGYLEERTGNATVRFFISPTSEEKAWNLSRIRKDWKRGHLIQKQPGHPLLTALRSFLNRQHLLAIQKDGARFRLAQVPLAEGVWQLVPSDTGLPGVTPATGAVVKTRDIKLAAALLTAGFPLLRLEGTDSLGHTYTHAAAPAPGSPPGTLDAARLIQDWRTDASAMPFALPFTQAATSLLFHQQIREEVKRTIHTVLISKPRTKMHAALRADAAPAAWDQVTHFFTGTL